MGCIPGINNTQLTPTTTTTNKTKTLTTMMMVNGCLIGGRWRGIRIPGSILADRGRKDGWTDGRMDGWMLCVDLDGSNNFGSGSLRSSMDHGHDTWTERSVAVVRSSSSLPSSWSWGSLKPCARVQQRKERYVTFAEVEADCVDMT